MFFIFGSLYLSFGQTTCDPDIVVTSSASPGGVVYTLSSDPPNLYGTTQYTWFIDADTLYGDVISVILDSTQQTVVCLETIDVFFGCSDFTCDSLFTSGSTNCPTSFDYDWPDSISVDLTAETFVDMSLVSSIDYTWTYLGLAVQGNPINIPWNTIAGTFYMCVTSEVNFLDGSICTETYCMDIETESSAGSNCSSSFTYTFATAAGFTIDFTPDSLNYLSYNWDFGDGNSSINSTPSNTYSTNGIYTVCLEVMNLDSCIAIYCEDIVIGNSPPADSCSIWIDYIVVNDTVIVSAYTDADPLLSSVIYYWDLFGVPFSANELIIPSSYFISDPALCITGIISYADGTTCTADLCEDIIINSTNTCDASFSFSYDPYDSLLVTFFPLDTVNSYVTYYWDFGDGAISSSAFPSYLYATNDEVSACLTVELIDAATGVICTDTYCLPVFEDMSGPPNPPGLDSCFAFYFYAINSDGMTVDFFSSLFGFPAGTVYNWDYGDGTIDTIPDPTHTFANDGAYNVCLSITDTTGCVETYCEWINISGTMLAYTLSGQVTLEGNDFAILYLVEYDPMDSSLTAVGSALGDYFNNGNYSFTDVSNGDYLIKAALIPGSEFYWDYLPTYYGDVELWSDATFVSILNADASNIDIDLIDGMNSGGPGFIGGLIIDGAGKLQIEGLAEIEVLLYNELGQPMAYTYSDEDGNYEFGNLAYGTYWLTADHPGYHFNMRQVILSAEQPTIIDADVQVGAEDILSSIEITEIEAHAISVYPTLVHSEIHISSEQEGTYFYNIIDIKGRSTKQGFASNGTTSLNLSELKTGAYLLSIQSAEKISWFRFVKE